MPSKEKVIREELVTQEHNTTKVDAAYDEASLTAANSSSSSSATSTSTSPNVSRTNSSNSIHETLGTEIDPHTTTLASMNDNLPNITLNDESTQSILSIDQEAESEIEEDGPFTLSDETSDSIKRVMVEQEKETLQEDQVSSTSTALIKRPDNLAVQISNLTNLSILSLDLAGTVTKFALETAKLSTRAGLGLARVMTGVRSEGLIRRRENQGIIDASAFVLHHTLSLTEQLALAGLEFTAETVSYTLSTVADSVSVVDTLFGSTDTAKALAEFVKLVKREWNFREEGESLRDYEPFGAFYVIKVLTAWACLQYVTSTRWEVEMGGWKKVKLVELWEIVDDWVQINPEEIEELELLMEEEEEDEEMVIISQRDDDNFVLGELTPRDRSSTIDKRRSSTMDSLHAQRLSELLSETAKRWSNPYLEECVDQTEEEKLYTILHNLKRYSKFSNTAYNIKTAIMNRLPFQRHFTKTHRVTFALQNDLPEDAIVHSSHSGPPSNGNSYQPTYYLIRDHDTKSIILALRGTLSIHDLIVDLSCEYEDFQLPEDIQRGDETKHKVHQGIMKVAKSLATPGSTVYEALKREMVDNEDYGLVLVGHSLGAGVASLLALLLASPTTRMTSRKSGLPMGRRVHAYAFAAPCVMSAELSKRSSALVTSVAYGNDVICRLSIGHVRDLRNMILYLGSSKADDNSKDLASTIIAKVLDYQSRVFSDNEEGRREKEEFEAFFWTTRQILHSRMCAQKLYPAGRIYWIVGKDRVSYCNVPDGDDDDGDRHKKTNHKYNMVEVTDPEKVFEEIWFSSTMIVEHLPYMYENVLKSL